MILPTKHQDISKNILVLGSEIYNLISKNDYTIEELFQKTKKAFQISLESFFDVLTFLWMIEAVKIENNILSLNKKDVSN